MKTEKDMREMLRTELIEPMTDSFSESVDAALERIRYNGVRDGEGARAARGEQRAKKRARVVTGICAAALCVTIASCTFALRPELAANIPAINEIVYTLSPEAQASEQTCARIADTVLSVFNSFASGGAEGAGKQFKAGDDWILNRDTYMAAYYLQYIAVREEVIAGVAATFENVDITSIAAGSKAFRYMADVSFDIVLKGGIHKSETARISLEESVSGFRILAIEMLSEGFAEYKALYELYESGSYDAPPKGYSSEEDFQRALALAQEDTGSLDANIANYNAMLAALERAMADFGAHVGTGDNAVEVAARAEQITGLAAELMYRYWNARKTGEMPELSDIMERTADTDLFFYDLQLMIDKVNMGYLSRLTTVDKGSAMIRTDYGDTVDVYVKTRIDYGVGQAFKLTVEKRGDKYIIVGYDSPWDDGVYRRLKGLADEYVNGGMERTAANKKAYEELLAEAERFVAEHPEYLIKND